MPACRAALFAALTLLSADAARAAPPRGPLDPLRYRDGLRQAAAGVQRLEFVEMLTAVLQGSQMGPGDGWFHPSQLRYDWPWLAARHGTDARGKIPKDKFRGPAAWFERLDRSKDGALSADDFDWSPRSALARQGMPATMWFYQLDGNSNGRISREEWLRLFERAGKGKDYLTAEDLRDAFPTSPPPRPQPPPGAKPRNQGPSAAVLVLGLLNGELGSMFEGPKVGQRAPDFTLKTPDGTKAITLSQFRGKKPVVLVFGSFT